MIRLDVLLLCRIEVQRRDDPTQQHIRPGFGMNQQRVLARPSKPGPMGKLAFQNRSGINKDFELGLGMLDAELIGQSPQPFLHGFVIVFAPSIACDPPLPTLDRRINIIASTRIHIGDHQHRSGIVDELGGILSELGVSIHPIHLPMFVIIEPLGQLVGIRRGLDACDPGQRKARSQSPVNESC